MYILGNDNCHVKKKSRRGAWIKLGERGQFNGMVRVGTAEMLTFEKRLLEQDRVSCYYSSSNFVPL